ncbi:trypsin-like peptidase domain-containing protein [Candidatus Woesearchaeota archaeon]|nr:trypsin-like peptidase domain-containing protein [Candidatus Woesearchaeota archaeon]
MKLALALAAAAVLVLAGVLAVSYIQAPAASAAAVSSNNAAYSTPAFQQQAPDINELRLRQLEAQLQDQELLMISRTSRQKKSIDEARKSAKELRRELSDVRGMASDLSSSVDSSMAGVVRIDIEIPIQYTDPWWTFFDTAKVKDALAKKGYKLSHASADFDVIPVTGSGAFVGSGKVLTNRHVANAQEEICNDEFLKWLIGFNCTGEPATIRVTGSDGRSASGSVSRLSSRYDLALMDTPLAGHKLRLGDSNSLKAGQQVVALGSPEGLDFSATQGIVSATRRDLNDGLGRFWIQTDAPINFGNSGGPLVDRNGEIVGIVTQKLGDEGLGFAVPSNAAKSEFGIE